MKILCPKCHEGPVRAVGAVVEVNMRPRWLLFGELVAAHKWVGSDYVCANTACNHQFTRIGVHTTDAPQQILQRMFDEARKAKESVSDGKRRKDDDDDAGFDRDLAPDPRDTIKRRRR